MTSLSVDETRIKDLLKQAVVELLEEREDLFSDLFAEAIEDLALVSAIKAGAATEPARRTSV